MFDPSAINTSFSAKLPGMQLAIDSTSLGVYKTCPMRYRLEILEGWTTKQENVHFKFGILLHSAREKYEYARVRGLDHDACLDVALDYVLRETWNTTLRRPWISDHPKKNRLTLIQTVVWYLDAKAKDDPLETVILANGKPAVELSFRFNSGVKTTKTQEDIILCGHMDRIAKLGINHYVPDIKTSSSDVTSPNWVKQFSPHNQFTIYTIAGKVAFDFDISGVMVDGIYIMSEGIRMHRAPIPRSLENLEEFMQDFAAVTREMEISATTQHWRKNEMACGMYGGCPWRDMCNKGEASRQKWLQAEYTKRVWDPMIPRGE